MQPPSGWHIKRGPPQAISRMDAMRQQAPPNSAQLELKRIEAALRCCGEGD